MQKTVLISRMITDDSTLILKDVTSLRVIVSENNGSHKKVGEKL